MRARFLPEKKVSEAEEDSFYGFVYLFIAMAIFSSSSSAYYWLNHFDPEVFDQCTVLCASNMVGLLFVLVFYRHWLSLETFKSLSVSDWLWLFVGSLFYSVLAPYLFMSGLDTVTVADAAILSRMESINILVLAFVFLGQTVSRWAMLNALLTFAGIVLTLVSPAFFHQVASFSKGNILILASGWAYSLSLLISMKTLRTIPVAVVAIFRVAIGTIMFHLLVLVMKGDSMELYNYRLWTYIGPYGIVWVFGGQVFWLLALSNVSSVTLSVGTTCLFVLTIFWSIVALGQLPTDSQWVGVAIITASIASSIAEKIHAARANKTKTILGSAAVSPLFLLQTEGSDPTALTPYSDLSADSNDLSYALVNEEDRPSSVARSRNDSDGSAETAWSETFRRMSSDRAVSYSRFNSVSFEGGVGFRGF